jgi:predicted metal-dependent enzyme (double-stranded beta helix superfamily)
LKENAVIFGMAISFPDQSKVNINLSPRTIGSVAATMLTAKGAIHRATAGRHNSRRSATEALAGAQPEYRPAA